MNSTAIKKPTVRRAALLVAVGALALLCACGRGALEKKEYVWVSAPQVNLRDRVAALYNRVGTAKNGDRLEVLTRQKRFVQVRTESGVEGWVEERYVVDEEVYNGFQKLSADSASLPAQGRGLARNAINVHLSPARDSEHLFQLKEGDRVELLKRGTGEKPLSTTARAAAAVKPAGKVKTEGAAMPAEPPPPVLEDWWLVRDAQKHAGWVLARMVDLDVPLDIAQYSEGQRIVGAYVLNTVHDPGYEPKTEDSGRGNAASPSAAPQAAPAQSGGDYHQRSQYLVLFTEPRDGMPFDFNQVRVFTWNVKRHRYETAYRERNLVGFLPVTIASETFDKEGTLPTFAVRVQAEDGKQVERKYRLNGPIVRRVVAEGEPPLKLARPEKPRPAKSSKSHRR